MLGGGELSQEAGQMSRVIAVRGNDWASVVDNSEGRSSVVTQRFGLRGRKVKR